MDDQWEISMANLLLHMRLILKLYRFKGKVLWQRIDTDIADTPFPCRSLSLQDDAPETDRADGIPLWLHAAWQEPVCVRAPLVWGFCGTLPLNKIGCFARVAASCSMIVAVHSLIVLWVRCLIFKTSLFQVHSIVMHCSWCMLWRSCWYGTLPAKTEVYDLNETTGYLNNYGLKTAGSLAVSKGFEKKQSMFWCI